MQNRPQSPKLAKTFVHLGINFKKPSGSDDLWRYKGVEALPMFPKLPQFLVASSFDLIGCLSPKHNASAMHDVIHTNAPINVSRNRKTYFDSSDQVKREKKSLVQNYRRIT